jgi:hypothetical protein
MSESITVTTTYVGVIDGLHTHEVRDESGNLIGKNESPYPPCPGEGWTLDEVNCVWIEA